MRIISEVIDEYCNKIISDKRKKIDFINDNYNLICATKQRKEVFSIIDDINKLKDAVKDIKNALNLIEEIESNGK